LLFIGLFFVLNDLYNTLSKSDHLCGGTLYAPIPGKTSKNVYNCLTEISIMTHPPILMRITQMYTSRRMTVWHSVIWTHIPTVVRSEWNRAVYDIITTNEQLYKIRREQFM